MPNIQSAKKRLRQDAKRNARNRARKSVIRTFTKKVKTSIEAGEGDAAEATYRTLQQKIDKAAKGNSTIHRNKAARIKSRLAKQLNAMKAENKG